MATEVKLADLTPEAISARIDELEDELDILETRPQGVDGIFPSGQNDHVAIRREQRHLLDELIRRGLF